jgi:hypothetical protein
LPLGRSLHRPSGGVDYSAGRSAAAGDGFLQSACRDDAYSFVLWVTAKETHMFYAILCYHDEDVVGAWTKEEDDAVLAKRAVVKRKLAAAGKLGPVARLMPTTAAVTVRLGDEPMVIDGPFAETKEQLLGLYIVDCATLEEVIEVAREMGRGERAAFEIRPLRVFEPRTVAT